MASEREAAKQAATEPEADDPQLQAAIRAAQAANVDYLREQNRHQEAIARDERGWLGRVFGGKDSAPTFIALFGMTAGLAAYAYCLSWASVPGADQQFWSDRASAALTFAGTALGFAVGKAIK